MELHVVYPFYNICMTLGQPRGLSPRLVHQLKVLFFSRYVVFLPYYSTTQIVSANGQITIPIEVRRKLNIKEGDKIIFLEKPNGEIILQNSSVIAIRQAQGKLDDIQLSEDEILQDVMDIRYSKKKQS